MTWSCLSIKKVNDLVLGKVVQLDSCQLILDKRKHGKVPMQWQCLSLKAHDPVPYTWHIPSPASYTWHISETTLLPRLCSDAQSPGIFSFAQENSIILLAARKQWRGALCPGLWFREISRSCQIVCFALTAFEWIGASFLSSCDAAILAASCWSTQLEAAWRAAALPALYFSNWSLILHFPPVIFDNLPRKESFMNT